MKKPIAFSFLIAFFLIACNSNKKSKGSITITNSKIDIHKTENSSDTKKILLIRTFIHCFSDPFQQDTFKLTMTGKSISEGKIVFDIISYQNKKIYSEKFAASDLMTGLDSLPTVKETEDTIRHRFYHFFDSDAFSAPALGRKVDEMDTDYVDLKIQKDIVSDTTAVGFTYAIGYESLIELAYSKKNKKTVICFASD